MLISFAFIAVIYRGAFEGSGLDETSLEYVFRYKILVIPVLIIVCFICYMLYKNKNRAAVLFFSTYILICSLNDGITFKMYQLSYEKKEMSYDDIFSIEDYVKDNKQATFLVISSGANDDIDRLEDTYLNYPNVYTVCVTDLYERGSADINKELLTSKFFSSKVSDEKYSIEGVDYIIMSKNLINECDISSLVDINANSDTFAIFYNDNKTSIPVFSKIEKAK